MMIHCISLEASMRVQQQQNLGGRFGTSKIHLSPPPPRWLRLLSVLRQWSVVVDFLFIATPFVGVCDCSMNCCTLLYVHSSFAIILMGKRELVALFVFLVSRDGCVALPRGAMGLSVVCDCGISCSYSLTILIVYELLRVLLPQGRVCISCFS